MLILFPFLQSDFFPDNEEHEGSELDAVKETLLKDAVFLKNAEETVDEESSSSQPPPAKKAKMTLGSHKHEKD